MYLEYKCYLILIGNLTYGHTATETMLAIFEGQDPKPLRPLVKTHAETGKKCLTIGRHINKIPGMTDQEAQNLARELEEYACSNQEWVYHPYGPLFLSLKRLQYVFYKEKK